ncbi:hypothetical protein [Herbiconiux liangxiaofengii]|uniref:hypothetical protein n=1 Tax=Herbiconiux liangxiaofengii TaxID=3342795 RepID=UPI0035B7739D
MSSRTTRVVRGLSAAAVAVFLAAFSHVVAGGGAPGQAGAALALAFSALVCIGLSGRTLSVPRLAGAVLISQFAFHLLFEVGSGEGSGLTVAVQHHQGHSLTTLVPDAVTGSADQLATVASHSHLAGLMWISHAVAAVVTIALLARGELVLRRLLALSRTRLEVSLGRLIRRSIATLSLIGTVQVVENSSARHRRRVFGERVAPVIREWMLALGSLGHRGPPRLIAAHPTP